MNEIPKIVPLMCDVNTGVCEVPAAGSKGDAPTGSREKPVRVLYFTDPICSSCWGIEPQIKKLKLEYGDSFTLEYRMGGLLKGWDSYGGSDVRGPGEVARHWDEASKYYDMPIDGDVWVEDPLNSSYPPSIAFKAAQLQDEEKALDFLRRIREMVFLEKKNITKWEYLREAALETGLDSEILKADFNAKGKELFNEDLALARQLGVKGFPSMFFTDVDNNRFLVYGSKPYSHYEEALLKLYPQAQKKEIDTSYETIFSHFPTLTTKEFSQLSNQGRKEAVNLLEGLYKEKVIDKYASKNGELWIRASK